MHALGDMSEVQFDDFLHIVIEGLRKVEKRSRSVLVQLA